MMIFLQWEVQFISKQIQLSNFNSDFISNFVTQLSLYGSSLGSAPFFEPNLDEDIVEDKYVVDEDGVGVQFHDEDVYLMKMCLW